MPFDLDHPILDAYLKNGQPGVWAEMAEQGLDTDVLLLYCAEHGDLAGVMYAVQHCDPTAHNSQALRLAVEYKHHAVVEFLIPYSHVGAEKSQALVRAVKNNDAAMVSLLLPYSNARDCKSHALHCAIMNKNADIAELLWPHSNLAAVEVGLRALKRNNKKMDYLWVLEQWPAMWQQRKLQAAVKDITPQSKTPARKI